MLVIQALKAGVAFGHLCMPRSRGVHEVVGVGYEPWNEASITKGFTSKMQIAELRIGEIISTVKKVRVPMCCHRYSIERRSCCDRLHLPRAKRLIKIESHKVLRRSYCYI